ncbi:hypothetical protein OBBRIDRAFT_883328 [Obba rivulosa]|uniref:Uncharacterized protein n=1 Tax=Obba rivulosa TaxID=1052685 RepID=A0A8E2J6U7_9APHY|nr:hypothetical protein OBBRIDRAFT_883328 [Obba rivulosa]
MHRNMKAIVRVTPDESDRAQDPPDRQANVAEEEASSNLSSPSAPSHDTDAESTEQTVRINIRQSGRAHHFPQRVYITRRIQKICFTNAGPRHCEMINGLIAPLVELDLSFKSEGPVSSESICLDWASFSSTLQVLKVRNDAGKFCPPSGPCPALHTLSLTHTEFADMRPLMESFPNLRNLIYTYNLRTWRWLDHNNRYSKDASSTRLVPAKTTLKELLETNVSAWQDDSWPLLEFISVGSHSLEIISPRKTLRRLHVDLGKVGDNLCLEKLFDDLAILRPKTLGLVLGATLECSNGCIAKVRELPQRYSGLTHLVLELACHSHLAKNDKIFAILVTYGQFFPSMTHLVLRVKWEAEKEWSEEEDRPQKSHKKALIRNIKESLGPWYQASPELPNKGLDVRRFVSRVFKHIPWLHYLVLDIPGVTNSYWLGGPGNDGKLWITELSTETGEDILRTEQIYFGCPVNELPASAVLSQTFE